MAYIFIRTKSRNRRLLGFPLYSGSALRCQIYGISGCEKINSYNGTRMENRRPRTNSAITSHEELSSVTAVAESERAGYQSVTSIFASNISADAGERQIVPQEEGADTDVEGETSG